MRIIRKKLNNLETCFCLQTGEGVSTFAACSERLPPSTPYNWGGGACTISALGSPTEGIWTAGCRTFQRNGADFQATDSGVSVCSHVVNEETINCGRYTAGSAGMDAACARNEQNAENGFTTICADRAAIAGEAYGVGSLTPCADCEGGSGDADWGGDGVVGPDGWTCDPEDEDLPANYRGNP